MKASRIAHAPSAPMPELAEFLSQFQLHFKRKESQTAAGRYIPGLLTEHPNKNCDTRAAAPGFFPLGRIGAGCRYRSSIAN